MAFDRTFSPGCPQRANAASTQELSRILGSGWLLQGYMGLLLSKIVWLVKFAFGAFLPPLPTILVSSAHIHQLRASFLTSP